MGVDLTLFVLARDPESQPVHFTVATFTLERDGAIDQLLAHRHTACLLDRQIQVPEGSTTTHRDGTPASDREHGFLSEDRSGQPLRWMTGREIAAVGQAGDGTSLNEAVLDFIRFHFGNHRVVLFWS